MISQVGLSWYFIVSDHQTQTMSQPPVFATTHTKQLLVSAGAAGSLDETSIGASGTEAWSLPGRGRIRVLLPSDPPSLGLSFPPILLPWKTSTQSGLVLLFFHGSCSHPYSVVDVFWGRLLLSWLLLRLLLNCGGYWIIVVFAGVVCDVCSVSALWSLSWRLLSQ